MRIICTYGNTESISNEIRNFENRLIRYSADSKTVVISVVCKVCGHETEQIVIGNW